MATRPLSLSSGGVALAAALPFVFLHVDYQPSLSVGLGSTDLDVTPADVALAVLAAFSLAALARGGLRRLAPARWTWLAAGSLLAWILLSTLVHADTAGYPFADHLVTAVKFAEYAVLAIAVPLLARTSRELLLVLSVLAIWTALAAAVGIAQFAGLDVFGAWPAGRRQPSFLGHHDLAALGGVALATAAAGFLLGGRWQRPAWLGSLAAVGGAVAMIVSGSLVGALGFALGVGLGALAARRRARLDRRGRLRLAGLVVLVCLATVLLRAGDIGQFGRFLGVLEERDSTTADVQTYSHRTLLAYVGLRIFLDHPVAGLGWQASRDERGYGPYLDDARRKFPDVAEQAFPSPAHPWGVQNAYVQALADLGAIGFALFLSVLVTGGMLAWRCTAGAPFGLAGPALAALVLLGTVAGVWSAEGLFGGLPLGATMWLAIGIAATAAAVPRERAGA